MGFNPSVHVGVPPRSNKDLSNIVRTSIAPGLLYPIFIRDMYSSDDISISCNALIKTLPLLGPLMGSFKFQLDFYEIPLRYYNKILHDDRVGFKPESVYFPRITLPFETGTELDRTSRVHPTSLMHYLGVPEVFVNAADIVAPSRRAFNAIPLLGYIDIFRSFYANTQEFQAYYISRDGAQPDPTPKIQSINMDSLDYIRAQILSASEVEPLVLNTIGDIPGSDDLDNLFNKRNHTVYNGGLFLRTFLPDRFSSWVDIGSYNAITTSSRIDVSGGFMTIDQFRFANHLNNMLLKTLVSGGRYSDWNKVQYGASLKFASEVPQFIGSQSTEINFVDVVQTTGHDDSDSPLGALGGRGHGGFGDRRIRHYFRENGFIMGILSIIPRVDYYQGVRHYLRFDNLGDLHVPEMDGIGFQDLLEDDFLAANSILQDDQLRPVPNGLGKQPAWTELTTMVNELHGEFAMPNALMYLTLARDMSAFTQGPTSSQGFTAYIKPDQFNYAFHDSSLFSTNFWVQLRFDVYIKRAMSKTVMPHL